MNQDFSPDDNEHTPEDWEAVSFDRIFQAELAWVEARRMSHQASHGKSHGSSTTSETSTHSTSVPGPVGDQEHEDSLEGTAKSKGNAFTRQLQSHALDKDLVGMAFSGGGIRSATFALGVLQRLAAAGILPRVDYLSTVSGGGYIGSWLSAWIQRQGFGVANNYLRPSEHRDLGESDCVEPDEIRHLRMYSNYLAPIPSVFSFDGWLLLAIYVRNLFLNLLVFILAVMGLIVLVRAVVDIYTTAHSHRSGTQQAAYIGAMYVVGLVAAYWSGTNAKNVRRVSRDRQWLMIIVPWFITANLAALVMVAAPWGELAGILNYAGMNTMAQKWQELGHFWRIWWIYGPLVVCAPTLLAFLNLKKIKWTMAWTGTIAGAVASLAIAGIVFGHYQFFEQRWHSSVASAVTFGVPAFLMAFLLISFLHVGLTGRHMEELHREWWSGANSRLAMLAAGSLLVFGCVVYGPWLMGMMFRGIANGSLVSSIVGTGWVGTVAGALLASSNGNAANSRWLGIVAKAAPFIFMATVAMGISTLAVWVFYDLYALIGDYEKSSFFDRLDLILQDLNQLKWFTIHEQQVPLPPVLLVCAGLLFWLSWSLGNRIGVNRFSLQNLYCNRLARCYLGASRERDPDPILNFDPEDDLSLSTLAQPSKDGILGPYHLVNTALNRKAGDASRVVAEENVHTTKEDGLALLERQAESFVFSPLFSGSVSTGYVPTKNYAADINLGTAMALSGAAVSPNMGYITSAPNRILLTLLNVRLGGWYGNPRSPTHAKEYDPGQSWTLLYNELAGKTGVDDPYVYISDGGHFENMGVYELIRRRCRFIIATDAGADPEFHDNIGRLIRQVRIDFGVRIEIDSKPITPDDNGNVEQHFVVAKIHYGDVHTPTARGSESETSQRSADEYAYENGEGILVWFKVGINGDEAGDVATYRCVHKDFPYQTTVDQFFSESQFEAYRELGEHSADELLDGIEDVLTQFQQTDDAHKNRQLFQGIHKHWQAIQNSGKSQSAH